MHTHTHTHTHTHSLTQKEVTNLRNFTKSLSPVDRAHPTDRCPALPHQVPGKTAARASSTWRRIAPTYEGYQISKKMAT